MLKFLTPIILGLLALGILFQLVLPRWGIITNLREQGDTLAETLNRTKEIQQKWLETKARFARISPENLHNIEEMLPSEPEMLELIRDIDAIASDYGLTLESASVDAPNETEAQSLGYEQYNLELSLRGRYLHFTEFLERLEHNLRILDVLEFSFDGGGVDLTGEPTPEQIEESEKYDYTLVVRTYWLDI